MTGSLTPGKQADIVVTGDVDKVLVAGRARKWGQVLGVDLDALRREVNASRELLFQCLGQTAAV